MYNYNKEEIKKLLKENIVYYENEYQNQTNTFSPQEKVLEIVGMIFLGILLGSTVGIDNDLINKKLEQQRIEIQKQIQDIENNKIQLERDIDNTYEENQNEINQEEYR